MDPLNLVGPALATSALAYIGPGPGLSMLTALLGLIATVLLAIVAVFFQPLRIMWRKFRNKGTEEAGDDAADAKSSEATNEDDDGDRDVA